MEQSYFPMFVNLKGKKILVIGGGKIAYRRVRTLLQFDPRIYVIAPEFTEAFHMMKEQNVQIIQRPYQEGDEEDAQIVFLATDDHELNYKIWKLCKEKQILVNVADDKKLCDFYFPSVVMNEDVVVGINSGGDSPGKVKKVRKQVESLLKGKTIYN